MATNVVTKDMLAATDTAGDNVQTPKAGSEIAVAWGPKDITRGYTLDSMLSYTDDYILSQQGGNDLRTYTEILRDEQAKACFEQRRSAVVSCEYVVEPGGKRAIDMAAAEFAKNQLDKISFDKVTDKMLFGLWYGYAAAEIIYEPGEKFLEWKNIKVRNQRRFGFKADGELRLRTLDGGLLGEEAPAPYFWTFNAGMEYDDAPYGKGLAHWVYWLVKFKRMDIKYWMIFAEKFGMPTAVGKFPLGTSEGDKAGLLAAASSIATESAITMPATCELDLIEAKRAGEAGYEAFCAYMDNAIAKAIVGQTMTSNNGSSRSQGEVHYTVRQDIVRSDANLVCDSFNAGPMAWLIGFNFPTAALPRVKRVIEEPQDLNVLAQRDQRLVSMGYRPSENRVTELYGEGYEAIPNWNPTPAVNAVPDQGSNAPNVPASDTGTAKQ
jgi:phage gp29-like protein